MRRSRTAAFTLLEMLAVVLIFALLASFVVPNLGLVRTRALRQQAQKIAAQIELARQRSIVTGVQHRLYIDIDEATYRLEWRKDGGAEEEEDPAFDLATFDLRGDAKIPLEAPRTELQAFGPLPGRFGRTVVLDDSLAFVGVETPGGWIDRGDAQVAFEPDGTTEYTTIVIDDETGRSIELEVLPLADAVRIGHEES